MQDSAVWLRFLYSIFPLPEQTQVIRVLALSANTDLDADPEVEFITLLLDATQRRRFQALSYVWGGTDDQKPVLLYGRPILVGKNLHSALRHVRSRDMLQPTIVWADAICINQMDLVERSRQVILMRALYTNAKRIILWQGEGTEVIEGAMALINSFVDSWICLGDKFVQCLLAQSDADNPDDLEAFAVAVASILAEEPSCIRRFCQPFILPESVIALVNNSALGQQPFTAFAVAIAFILDENPFWSRLWILQETVIAMRRSSGFLQIGSHKIHLGKMLCAVLLYYVVQTRLRVRGRSADPGLDTTGPLLVQRFGLAGFPGLLQEDASSLTRPLLQALLTTNRELKATDPKDRVYGFLGVLPDLGLEPDYTKSVSTIYQEATMAVIQKQQSLDIFINICLPDATCADLPSWASTWSTHGGVMHATRVAAWDADSWITPDDNRNADPADHGDPEICYNACPGVEFAAQQVGTTLHVLGFRLCRAGDVQGFGPSLSIPEDSVPSSVTGWARKSESLGENFDPYRSDMLDYYLHWRDRSTDHVTFEKKFINLLFLDRTNRERQGTQSDWDIVHERSTLGNIEQPDTIICKALTPFPRTLLTHRVAMLENKVLCLLPNEAQAGDEVFLLAGCYVPFLLRPSRTGCGTLYSLVGPAYVDGVMDGEPLAEAPRWVSTGNPDATGVEWSKVVLM
ncbi:hypothetical protein M409DRAFT_29616 [Zasmidium cellare ATCC 36951]|uniref:Heterokaryon incompatibility domain-containing protein n=1 Tax=Zasmidium cellare ATCC 36951 TaxID=1080233 RepID=A0A6A6C3N4_ZASCE|nr:uncharacterized protein M409DRAFT_29616 [Zasmidium cellare ATCC 36951]KAF2160006.1 hypothetical protein M409DRAFT_29616 [Zasmidium cellare ATCC 36951]